jgi:transcriptional regulator with XRE-family HTH domain
MEKLRDYIRQAMKEKGLSVAEIVRRSGNQIKDSYIFDILKGRTKTIGVEKLNALAQGLGVDGVELYKLASGENIPYSQDEPWPGLLLSQTISAIVQDPDLSKIVKALIASKPAQIKAVKKTLKIN